MDVIGTIGGDNVTIKEDVFNLYKYGVDEIGDILYCKTDDVVIIIGGTFKETKKILETY